MSIRSWFERTLMGTWLKRRRLDEEDFQEEIRAHVRIAADERVADGADRKSAHDASLKDFGNVLLTREAARRVWIPWWLDALRDQVSDIRYAIRALAKNPVFALTVIAVLTLGIGLNAAVFSILKSLYLTPLAGVDGSARLAVIYGETSTGRDLRVSYPDYQFLRDHDRGFRELFGSTLVTLNLGRGRSARPVWGELVTGNYFHVLRVHAERGRTLLPSDEIAPGRHPVIVLSDGLWQRDFGADPNIVGKTVEVNNYRLTVVGVADPAFHGTIVSYDIEVFIPVMMAVEMGATGGLPRAPSSNVLSDRRAMLLFPHGFLRPGATLGGATAQTDALWATLARDRPLTDPVRRLRVVPFWQSPTGAQTFIMPAVAVLSAMGPLVLLIACANIAGLVLVRGVSRRGEIAMRQALGSTRTRIVRLLIVENLVLAAPGALLGLALAWNGIPVLVGYAENLAAPQRLFFNIQVDGLMVGFAVLTACASALVFGFVPALRTSRVTLVSVINEDASPRGAARGRLRAALVVAQVAVSFLLLVGAGLLTRSLDAARRAYPGYDPKHVAAVSVDLNQDGYDETRGRVFYRDLLNAARADPSVDSATLAASTPLTFLDTRARRVAIDGYEPRRGEDLSFLSNVVGPDYFRTLRIPLIVGRGFEARDDDTVAPVAVVNQTLARQFWGGAANAIGKRVRVGDDDWRTVIGVAADVKYARINELPRPYIYLPFLQSYQSNMILHVRGRAPESVLVDQARARIKSLDADLPILFAGSLDEATRGALIMLQFMSSMLFVFGAAGMALAALGTYGLLSYIVKQSTHEVGIRMALGAPAWSVVRALLGRGLRLGTSGAALGLVMALGLSRLLGSVLFGVSPTDVISFTRALAVVLGGVVAATIVPAWRAAHSDPLRALRHQ